MDEAPERDVDQAAGDDVPLRCAACGLDVADASAVVSIGGRDPVGTFVNPAGVRFEVLTVSAARNLAVHGPPEPRYAWFPGYAWSFAHCARCATHLGWDYVATADARPARFVGFIRSQVR